MESLRNAWLEREEVILNHLRVSAAMFRWGYRILGIIAALVAAIPTGLVFWVCVQYHRAKAQRPSCKTEKPVL